MTQEVNVARFFDGLAGVRGVAVNLKAPLMDLCRVRPHKPVPLILLGRALSAASLLAAQMEEEEVISLYFKGDGMMESLFAEASYEGKLRGFTPHPELEIPILGGRIDFPVALGQGHMTVVRTHPRREVPYRGSVEIQNGEVGEEVAFYLHQSEQRPAYINVGVKLNANFEVESAGGVLLELLPGATETVAVQLEQNAQAAMSITERLVEESDLEKVMAPYFAGFQMKRAEHPYRLEFFCPCSKERLIRSMRLFTEDDLRDIVEKKETTQARCEFCGAEYQLSWDEVKDIKEGKHRKGLH